MVRLYKRRRSNLWLHMLDRYMAMMKEEAAQEARGQNMAWADKRKNYIKAGLLPPEAHIDVPRKTWESVKRWKDSEAEAVMKAERRLKIAARFNPPKLEPADDEDFVAFFPDAAPVRRDEGE